MLLSGSRRGWVESVAGFRRGCGLRCLKCGKGESATRVCGAEKGREAGDGRVMLVQRARLASWLSQRWVGPRGQTACQMGRRGWGGFEGKPEARWNRRKEVLLLPQPLHGRQVDGLGRGRGEGVVSAVGWAGLVRSPCDQWPATTEPVWGDGNSIFKGRKRHPDNLRCIPNALPPERFTPVPVAAVPCAGCISPSDRGKGSSSRQPPRLTRPRSCMWHRNPIGFLRLECIPQVSNPHARSPVGSESWRLTSVIAIALMRCCPR